MLRCTLIALFLAGCASAPVPVPEPVEPSVVQAGTAAAPVEAAPADEATPPQSDAAPAEDGLATNVIMESERFEYSMTLRLPNGKPDIRCSYGKRTGSHVQDKYCRTTHDAELERDAAREFFDEARRKGR